MEDCAFLWLLEEVYEKLEEGRAVDVVYLDFEKSLIRSPLKD